MPRELSRGAYTADQVRAALYADVGAMRPRFDLVDRDYRVIDRLDVTAATVDWDGTRTIPRSLTMTMLPRTDLLFSPFLYLVKPYWALQMLAVDGGWAEFPMGAYPFTSPTRQIDENAASGSGTSDLAGDGVAPENPETWTITLGDQMHYLDAGGVGPAGFTVPQGSLVTDGIINLLARNNFADTSGIQRSEAVSLFQLMWTLRAGAQTYNRYFNATGQQQDQVTLWSHVAAALHTQLGYQPPGFDLDNDRYVARPAVDYSQTLQAPVIVYEAGQDSLLLPGISSTPALDKVANRVTVTGQSPSGFNDVAVADLNTLIPGHPLSQGVLGWYIEAAATSTVAANQLQLQAQANAILYERLRTYETVTFSSLANPMHDAWEILSLRVPGDARLDSPQLAAEMGWSFDLFTGQMHHDARLLGLPGIAQ